MKYMFFYIPLYYFYKTRLKSIAAVSNWIFIYVVPTWTFFLVMSQEDIQWSTNMGYMAAIFAIYSIYEAGYIQNDTETIKHESQPTLRLSEKELLYYEKHKYSIYAARIFLAFFFVMLAVSLIKTTNTQIIIFVLAIILIGAVYQIYNRIRNVFTLPLLFFLVSLRYITPILLQDNSERRFYLLWIVLLYPVLNLLEWMYKPRFYYLSPPFSLFAMRFFYYVSLCSILGFKFYHTSSSQYAIAFFLASYFLVYRVFFYFIYKTTQA